MLLSNVLRTYIIILNINYGYMVIFIIMLLFRHERVIAAKFEWI